MRPQTEFHRTPKSQRVSGYKLTDADSCSLAAAETKRHRKRMLFAERELKRFITKEWYRQLMTEGAYPDGGMKIGLSEIIGTYEYNELHGL